MRSPRYVKYCGMLKRLGLWFAFGLVVNLSVRPHRTMAHEGHAALPSKGLTVSGDELLLSEGARKAIGLTTAKVALADLGRTVECNARVELPWSQQALVTTQVPGRITDVYVRPGDAVKAGQELARVDSLELESLQLAMLQADTELTFARDLFQRRSGLAAQGAIAGREALDAETDLKQKTADLQIALCKLRAVGIDDRKLADIRASRKPLVSFAVVSPIAGTVAEADVRIGQQVKTTEHLFHIVDSSTVWVIGSVLESDTWQVEPGQRATVAFKSLPDQTFSGKIQHLRVKLDEKQRTRPAVVELTNPAGQLRAGMFGRLSIEVGEAREAVICPADGIISSDGGSYALLQRGEGSYVRKSVRLGIRDGDRVEIIDGLFPGDHVVTTGNHVLFSLFGGASPTASPASDNKQLTSESKRRDAAYPQDRPSQAIVAQGIVEVPTDRKAFAGSRIEGRVGRILVQHSQHVKTGDVLAEIDSLELRNVQGDVLETEARLSWTDQRLESITPLAQQRVIAQTELQKLQTDQRVLVAQRDSLLRQLSMIGVSDAEVDRLRRIDLSAADCKVEFVRSILIRAAIDGTVANFTVVPGQVVNNESQLFEIQNTSTVWVRGHLFQQDATEVREGQSVRLTFAALPDSTVAGKVIRLSPVLEATERVLPVWVEVSNSDGRLIEGMWARMEIDVGAKPLAQATSASPQ